MLVCNCCGKLIEDEELGYGHEPHGERTPNSCSCGGDFIQATECKICGEYFDNSDLHGVCECCMEDYELVGTALEMGACNTDTVEGINGFIASVLSVEEMNKILGKWVEEHFIDHSKYVKDYVYNDKMEFSDFIIKEQRG